MDLSQVINTDTVKLTLIPGLIVVLVLFFWFRRSVPKANIRTREAPRSRNTESDPLFDPLAAGEPEVNGTIATRQALDGMNDVVVVKRSPMWERKMAEAAQRAELPLDTDTVGPVIAETPVDARLANRVEPAKNIRAETKTAPAMTTAARAVSSSAMDVALPRSTSESVATASKEKTAASDARGARVVVDRELENGMMLVLNIYAEGRPMRGPAVLKAVTAAGLAYGKMGVFHYVSPQSGGHRPLFSLANMVEPGSFNLNNLEELSTPGLCLFANVARPDEAMTTFNAMLETARKLADALHANVCDERRGTLSKQGIEHVYMRIQDFQRRSRLAQAASA